MLAVDFVTVALVVAVVVLCVTTAASALALPSWSWRRRHRGHHLPHYPVLQRRVVTGPPASAPLALPPAPRQRPRTTDDRESAVQVHDAESLIEHLLENDPARLAALITAWINSDDDHGNATA